MANLRKIIHVLTAGIGLNSLINCSPKNIPEVFNGFPELNQGYVITEFNVPTKGDIVSVSTTDETRRVILPDSSIIYLGPLHYTIQPDRKFMPQDLEHSDMYGRTPWNNEYWSDVRPGLVILERANS